MSESTALAKALAAQLGDSLDRILDDNESGQPAPEFTIREEAALILELRQVAGLNAGFTQPLSSGDHFFGAGSGHAAGDDKTRPFSLAVDQNNEAWLSGEDRGVRLDGLPVKARTAVGRGVIDAGSARFLVAQSRPPARRRNGGQLSSRSSGSRLSEPGGEQGAPRNNFTSGPHRPGRIRIADYVSAADKPSTPAAPVKTRRFGKRTTDRNEPVNDGPLIAKLLEVREAAVVHARNQFPDPGQIIQMATAGDDHTGHIGPDDEGFGIVPIAYGDLAWQPPFDRPDRIPGPMVVAVQQHAVLPSVPLTVDLKNGHLGLVGERGATLAVARQIALALRILSPIEAISFALLNPPMTQTDWDWLDRLQNRSTGLPILFIDGMNQVSASGMRQMLSEQGAGGAVIIDDQLHDIPSLCKTVLEIKPSGNAALLDFRRGATTTRVATPLGFSYETTDQILSCLEH